MSQVTIVLKDLKDRCFVGGHLGEDIPVRLWNNNGTGAECEQICILVPSAVKVRWAGGRLKLKQETALHRIGFCLSLCFPLGVRHLPEIATSSENSLLEGFPLPDFGIPASRA